MRWLLWLFALLLCCSAAPAANPDVFGARRSLPLDAGWRFERGDMPGAADPALDDGNWEKVTLPHSFNAADGERPGYYRGPGWYRRTIHIGALDPARRLFIEFDGAALSTRVFVNGVLLGQHDGGHARFRFDLTPALRPGSNVLAIRVDNGEGRVITPLGGDFTLFGGLYRSVRLVETGQVHIDMLDAGGPGVYATLTRIDGMQADVAVEARLTNDAADARTIPVEMRVLDHSGRQVAIDRSELRVAARTTGVQKRSLTIAKPRRWDGVRDPYLYTLQVRLGGSGDAISVPLGLREFRFDAGQGLLLNGRPYALHGANLMASARPGRGTAVTREQIDEDFEILSEMGSTGVRLVHFQHGPEAYAAADRLGLVTWTEIGINSQVADTPEFRANAAQQLRELIAQNYNHPSILLWGIGNEVYSEAPSVVSVLTGLHEVARALDPTRPTIYAHCCQADDHPKARVTDLVGFNRYFGWYPDQKGGLGNWAANFHKAHPDRPFAISEYGAGASVLHQEDPPRTVVPTSGWHPEQYQTEYHERNWAEIAPLRYVFGKFVWVAFDLASAGRHEGDRRGINDKGLVTYDRRVRKDAWYWYQANWSARPMVHITGRRFSPRPAAEMEVKVYSNLPRVALTLNGRLVGVSPVVGRIARWKVRLREGENILTARAIGRGGASRVDTVSLSYAPPPAMVVDRGLSGARNDDEIDGQQIPGAEALRHWRWMMFRNWLPALCAGLLLSVVPAAAEPPRLVTKNGRHALIVDGAPFLMLGAQVNNSSNYPEMLPKVWPLIERMHANTVEVPVAWEQIEPREGAFDFSFVDTLVEQARARNIRVVLLWFATWKNTGNSYAPAWVKRDTARFPRMRKPDGSVHYALSPHGRNTLEADKAAFVALMRHLAKIDPQHTVIMVQPENEPGSYGLARDHSPEADKLFKGPVPRDLTRALGKPAGTWTELFGKRAEQFFQTWYMARFIDEVAQAGKAAHPLPMYVNAALGDAFTDEGGNVGPFGGPNWNVIPVWKAAAPHIDLLAPDIYTRDPEAVIAFLDKYARPDNALMVPEIGNARDHARFLWPALGRGAIGFAPFGMDETGFFNYPLGATAFDAATFEAFAAPYRLLAPNARAWARIAYENPTWGTAKGAKEQSVTMGRWRISAEYGLWQMGEPGWSSWLKIDPHPVQDAPVGGMMVAQLAPDTFLVSGTHVRVRLGLADAKGPDQAQLISAEEGSFVDGQWKVRRRWNGDQIDYGLNFTEDPVFLKVTMGTYR